MWLINATTLKLEFFHNATDAPYAILSHTWGDEEVSFQDFQDTSTAAARKGYGKIVQTCEHALKHDPPLQYCWVDTCCIDKSSSAELTEAINSMWQWYKQSRACFVFLSDLPARDGMSSPELFEAELSKCRWFERGWTLQELIAPPNVLFYDQRWGLRGTKSELKSQLERIKRITTVPWESLLDCDEAQDCGVARKMSWASRRRTTRVEDTAYCLLGLFGVHMPLIYGEGEQAFIRLQEHIIKDTNDRSIFAWISLSDNEVVRGIFASSPAEFIHSGNIRAVANHSKKDVEFTLTNKGMRFTDYITIFPEGRDQHGLDLECIEVIDKEKPVGFVWIPLLRIAGCGFAHGDFLRC
ncbi:uncharacterized protein JN550_001354 [Neoarthrinium moseri]|uniref:uncharacterized protein n=1 Tax=Neoarthrinium moseri TaxID=1658444 RepID=UPI001FDC5814|nr:uncharacterized protein JN550_001354 [Neoarthrinium moseri]KAI1877282.1 hypothetical protein JN550_001354 [Neoarthrinium moseri]